MKSFGRLLAVSRRFYLCTLAIIVVFVLIDCMLLCNDREVCLTKSEVKQMVQTNLTEENGVYLVENHYLSFEDIAKERGTELFGLFVVMLGVMSLLFAREIAFADTRTQEFRCMWPIKNWVRELYDYVAMLLVIVLGLILEIVILLLIQIRYNGLVIEVLVEQGLTSKVTDMMATSNQHFLLGMACYLIAIVTSYTWISLGMSLAKNSIVGAIVSVIVKGLVQLVWDWFSWSVILDYTSSLDSTQLDYYNVFANFVVDIGDCLLINGYFFDGMDVKNGSVYGLGNVFTVFHWMIAQALFCLLFIIGLIISAKRKDLAKGTMLYFPMLGYPLGLMVGIGVFVICYDWLYWSYDFEVIVSVVLSLSAAIGTFLLCRPVSKSKPLCLEVK